ncbi:MAG TPA: hypothetical protein ENL00_00400 [Nitratifractor sp.]|nr:hypothetical protein [Nitratifractor sp.]
MAKISKVAVWRDFRVNYYKEVKLEDLKGKIEATANLDDLESLRVEIFGKKGLLAAEFAKLKDIASENKKEFAKGLNDKKIALTEVFEEKKRVLLEMALEKKLESERVDVSLYGYESTKGACKPPLET